MGKDEDKTKTIKDGTEKMQIRRVRNGNYKKKMVRNSMDRIGTLWLRYG